MRKMHLVHEINITRNHLAFQIQCSPVFLFVCLFNYVFVSVWVHAPVSAGAFRGQKDS